MPKADILDLITKNINMRKNKKQYAKPIKVSDIRPYQRDGLPVYEVTVIFNNNIYNIPSPWYLDPENVHIYQDPNTPSAKVKYSFPFMGYGIISGWMAKHWMKKMCKQIDPANLKPLYELHDANTMEYICSETGKPCEMATKHFEIFKTFVDDCAKNKSTRTITVQEINNCRLSNCVVWQNYIAKLKQKIK